MRRTALPLPRRPYRHHHVGRPVEIELPLGRRARIRYGADLFDHGAWWESHVAWEAAWLTWPRQAPEASALKGLIQAAAMQLKASPERARAHRSLQERSVAHLEAAVAAGLTVLEGIALEDALVAVRGHAQGDPPLQLGEVEVGPAP